MMTMTPPVKEGRRAVAGKEGRGVKKRWEEEEARGEVGDERYDACRETSKIRHERNRGDANER